MKGIAEMFAELSGVQEYEDSIEMEVTRLILRKRENVKLWRIKNPLKYQALRRKCRRNWRRKHPAKYRAAQQRYKEKNLDKVRKWNREAQRRRRERLRRKK